MLNLFIANKNYSSWSLRPWVLMRQLKIPFEEKLVPFGGKAAPDMFRSFSPSGRVPCLIDGTTVVWDSLAITEYLAEQTPQVWPADVLARAWARCAAAEMHSGFNALRECCTMNCGVRVRLNEHSAGLQHDIARIDELWSEGLARFGGPFLAGSSFTAVDAFFAPVAFRVQTYGLPLSPAAVQYVERLLALEPMQEWYAAALDETWREEDHETEVRQAGTVLEDRRAAGS
ncbi:MAG: glutathione S-transferase family protein [Rhodocyclaceae bacterium]|jgi:glutathione S-transferase|nr:glutathione S-transferase family protein [Rhodocyclaceae bacterium]